jgi:DNA mismatch repair protein MSH6
MVGVPEASIDYWVAKFLGQGYKVGRVEQAETALGADLRRKDAKGSKTSKAKAGPNIVNRELKTVLTTGTVVDGELMTDDLSVHCIAIKESFVEGNTNPTFGIVVADCSTAEFQLCTFQVRLYASVADTPGGLITLHFIALQDDACRTQLETIIRQHRPRDLVYERGNLSGPTTRLLRAAGGLACQWTGLKPGTEFPAAEDALGQIRELFNGKDADGEDAEMDLDAEGDERVPQQIKELYGSAETMSALGGMLYYLKGVGGCQCTNVGFFRLTLSPQLNLDKDLLTVNNFSECAMRTEVVEFLLSAFIIQTFSTPFAMGNRLSSTAKPWRTSRSSRTPTERTKAPSSSCCAGAARPLARDFSRSGSVNLCGKPRTSMRGGLVRYAA